jgi:aldose sugar dehydrogenase
MRDLFLLAVLLLTTSTALAQAPILSDRASFRLVEFAVGLDHPWGGTFLPDGRLLVTERPGRMRLVGRDGNLSAPLTGVPAVASGGQAGLLDIALAPDFITTRGLYFCQAAQVTGGVLTRLVRARLGADGTAVEDATPILDATPPQAQGRNHFGCRIAFAPDGTLFLSTGERFINKMRAQQLDDLAGKVLRLARDGTVPPDNPFLGRPNVRPEIFSYGHRNPQGLAINPWTGSLWQAELGPRGGDEINIIRPGRNYGWPVVTEGTDYDQSEISKDTLQSDTEEPAHYWVPSVSPSGIAFYSKDAFPGWHGSLFVACLNPPGLVRLSTEGDEVTGEERLLWRQVRFRHVLQGPEGFLYILTDETRGRILRLEPS